MSEGKPEWQGTATDSALASVHDAGDPRRYFTMIPNVVDDMGLSPCAVRLYVRLKRVAGDAGVCWQSTETLAKACGMSTGSVSEAKRELVKAKLVSINKAGPVHSHHITIVDIWATNMASYAPKPPSPQAPSRSQCESALSHCETKKNPTKKNAEEERLKDCENADAFSSAAQIHTVKAKELAAELEAAAQPYVDAYCTATNITPLDKDLKELRAFIVANRSKFPPVNDFAACVRYKVSDSRWQPWSPKAGFEQAITDYGLWVQRGRPDTVPKKGADTRRGSTYSKAELAAGRAESVDGWQQAGACPHCGRDLFDGEICPCQKDAIPFSEPPEEDAD